MRASSGPGARRHIRAIGHPAVLPAVTLLVIALCWPGRVRAAPIVSEWTRTTSGGLWSDGANWSTNPVVPDNTADTAFDARIGIGREVALTLDLDVELERFQFSGGSLAGSGSITVTDELTWNAGTLAFESLASYGTAGIEPIPNHVLGISGTTTLENLGTLTLRNDGSSSGMGVQDGAALINRAGGLFQLDGNGEVRSLMPRLIFTNEGILRRLPGDGFWHIIGDSLNTGRVEIQGGQLEFRGVDPGQGGLTNQGVIQVDAGAGLTFRGTAAPGSSITGAGDVRLSNVAYSGSLDVTGLTTVGNGAATFTSTDLNFGGGLVIDTAGQASFLGGPLTVGDLTVSVFSRLNVGDLSVEKSLDWTFGDISTTGIVSLHGTSVSDGGDLLAGTLDNIGTLKLGNTGIAAGARLRNSASGTVEATGNLANGGAVENAGLFRVVTDESFFNVAFDNSGSFILTQGSVSLFGGGRSTGQFEIASGASLNFWSGHVLESGSSVSGLGRALFGHASGSSGVNVIDGTIAVAKLLASSGENRFNESVDVSDETYIGFRGGVAVFQGPIVDLGDLVVDGGTARFLSAVPALRSLAVDYGASGPGIQFFRSELYVDGDLEVGGLFDWTGGKLSGPGTTYAQGGLTMDVAGTGPSMVLDGRTLVSGSDATWTQGPLDLQNGAVFQIAELGNLSLAGFVDLTSSDKTGTLLNAGTVRPLAASDPEVFAKLDNRGAILVEGAKFGIRGGGINWGLIEAGAGGTVEIGRGLGQSGQSVFDATADARISGDGTVAFTPGSANILGVYDVQGETELRGSTLASIVRFGASTQNLGSLTGVSGRGIFSTPASVGNVVNNGASIEVHGTTLMATGSYTSGGGTLLLDEGMASFATGVELNPAGFVGGGRLGGIGTVDADVVVRGGAPVVQNLERRGTVAPGLSGAGRLEITGDLTLDEGKLSIRLGGRSQGDEYSLVSVGGVAVLDGVLELDFISGFGASAESDDLFTVLVAESPLLGTFLNVANGQRLSTIDRTGGGSFVVNYGEGSPFGPTSIVLSHFVPEPSTVLLIGGGLILLAARRRGQPAV